jgi:hypothetical protein
MIYNSNLTLKDSLQTPTDTHNSEEKEASNNESNSLEASFNHPLRPKIRIIPDNKEVTNKDTV